MPRFVLLYHACPPNYERPSHWDLMLEVGDALHTWALQELPSDWRAAQRATMAIDSSCPPVATVDAVDARQLGHHRKSYLLYEGRLSGDRGLVHRIDSGNYVGEQPSPKIWRLALEGSTVRCSILLQQESDNVENWVLCCEKR